MMKQVIFLSLLILIGCKLQPVEEPVYREEKIKRKFIEPISKMLNAHGGYDQWLHHRMLSYHLKKDQKSPASEIHTVDLQNRRIYILADNYELGYDGKDIWVAPDLESFPGKSPRFYHNLYFYFHALPFLVADPGVNYEDQGIVDKGGKNYHEVRITYENGVGDSSEDEYILYLDEETYRLSWILYTVTYFSGKESTAYNALQYKDWVEVNDVLLPATITGYTYENGEIKDEKYSVHFSDIELLDVLPEVDPFVRPEVSEVITDDK